MRHRISLLCLLSAALPVAASATPTAGASPQRPLVVLHSSLVQSARYLVWTVQLAAKFSPGGLRPAGRSLCLLLERSSNASVAGQLCVIGPRSSGASARVVYQRVTRSGPGRAAVVPATVTRAGARELTATFLPAAIANSYGSLHWQVLSSLNTGSCAPHRSGRTGCRSLFPAAPVQSKLHTPQLVGCTPSGPAFVNSGPIAGREIALTFDDGPWSQTSQFLAVLEHYGVPATFFEIGRQIGTYGQGGAIERRMLADGDMIGDHTWSHANVAAGGGLAAGEISQAADAIRQATGGFQPCLFRAPYGAVSGALISEARSMGFTTIQWDVDPRDWARPGTGAIYGNVVGNAHPGAIILQHDGGGDRSETLAALPQEITTLRARGYKFVTVTQLLGLSLIYR